MAEIPLVGFVEPTREARRAICDLDLVEGDPTCQDAPRGISDATIRAVSEALFEARRFLCHFGLSKIADRCRGSGWRLRCENRPPLADESYGLALACAFVLSALGVRRGAKNVVLSGNLGGEAIQAAGPKSALCAAEGERLVSLPATPPGPGIGVVENATQGILLGGGLPLLAALVPILDPGSMIQAGREIAAACIRCGLYPSDLGSDGGAIGDGLPAAIAGLDHGPRNGLRIALATALAGAMTGEEPVCRFFRILYATPGSTAEDARIVDTLQDAKAAHDAAPPRDRAWLTEGTAHLLRACRVSLGSPGLLTTLDGILGRYVQSQLARLALIPDEFWRGIVEIWRGSEFTWGHLAGVETAGHWPESFSEVSPLVLHPDYETSLHGPRLFAVYYEDREAGIAAAEHREPVSFARDEGLKRLDPRIADALQERRRLRYDFGSYGTQVDWEAGTDLWRPSLATLHFAGHLLHHLVRRNLARDPVQVLADVGCGIGLLGFLAVRNSPRIHQLHLNEIQGGAPRLCASNIHLNWPGGVEELRVQAGGGSRQFRIRSATRPIEIFYHHGEAQMRWNDILRAAGYVRVDLAVLTPPFIPTMDSEPGDRIRSEMGPGLLTWAVLHAGLFARELLLCLSEVTLPYYQMAMDTARKTWDLTEEELTEGHRPHVAYGDYGPDTEGRPPGGVVESATVGHEGCGRRFLQPLRTICIRYLDRVAGH